jgi:release factor glutamine methyltransferase
MPPLGDLTIPARLRAAVQTVAAALAAVDAARPPGLQPATAALREAEALVLASLGLPRSTLYADPERALSLIEQAKISHWLHRRRDGEPLAYLLGEREFWSLTLTVSPAVLVPRPETELLVERALLHGDALEAAGLGLPTVLDLGTGSGAIAIAIAHERPGWRVTAVERSGEALAIARQNAARHAVGLELLQGDWFAPVAGRRFHVIAANPPYVAADDPVLQGDSLRHEPRAALTPGDDGFADLAHLAATAPRYLAPAGSLLLEHGTTQGARLRAELVARGFRHVVSHRDLAGHERVTEGRVDSSSLRTSSTDRIP